MLTPIEIQRKTFKSGIGYEKKDVDQFIKEILANYELLYKENVELSDKINVLSEGIQYYKTIEKTLQKALVLAQKTADETKAASVLAAEATKKEARAEAELIVGDAKRELDSLHGKIINIIQQYDVYKAQFRQLAAAQLQILESESFQIQLANLDTFLAEALPDAPKEPVYRNVGKDEFDSMQEERVNKDEELPSIDDLLLEMEETEREKKKK